MNIPDIIVDRETEYDPIPGYEGLFEAAMDGRIRNVQTGRILTPFPDKSKGGHLHVDLHANGKRVRKKVRQLVMRTYVGTCPPGFGIVHYDGDILNCDVDNMVYRQLTYTKTDLGSPNLHIITKPPVIQLPKTPRPEIIEGERQKMTIEIARDIRSKFASGERTMAEIAKERGIDRKTVWQIVNNKSWKERGDD